MSKQVKIHYSATLIGQRLDKGTISVPEALAGVSRGSTPPQLNLRTLLLFLEDWVRKNHCPHTRKLGHVDLKWDIQTEDGFIDLHVLPQGFDTMIVPGTGSVPMLQQLEKPAPASVPAPEPVKQSKYQAKQAAKQELVLDENDNAVPAPVKPAKREFVWKDRTDEVDAIPDDQLTAQQRRKRREIADRAEAQAYGSFVGRRGR